MLSQTRVPPAADACPFPSLRLQRCHLLLVGVWTVFCSAAILGLFIVQRVSLTRKKIPAAGKGRWWSVRGSRVTVGTALSSPGCQGCCGSFVASPAMLQGTAVPGAFLQQIHLEAFPLKKINKNRKVFRLGSVELGICLGGI